MREQQIPLNEMSEMMMEGLVEEMGDNGSEDSDLSAMGLNSGANLGSEPMSKKERTRAKLLEMGMDP